MIFGNVVLVAGMYSAFIVDAEKCVEYDIDKELLTYQHEGTHICALKPNVKERRKSLDTLPIPLSGTTKPLQYMKDCMQFHLDSGKY